MRQTAKASASLAHTVQVGESTGTDSAVSHIGPARVAMICLLIAVLIAAVTLVLFAPRFVLWRGLAHHHIKEAPEYGRAKVTLEQVNDPWVPPRVPLHQVVRWRLFFPLIWHYLYLPPGSLLGMPILGCLAVLGLVSWLTFRRMHDWPSAILAAMLFAPLPWFFVSTGWLLHFDSWLVLAILIVAFVSSRAAVSGASLIAPWVDERFILSLPVALLVRAIALYRLDRAAWRGFFVDAAAVASASMPYFASRFVAYLSGDALSAGYVRAHWAAAHDVPVTQYLAGLWSGYRAAWAVIAAAIILTVRRTGAVAATALGLTVAGTAIGGLFIAMDMSRTLMMISPVLLLGVWLWESRRARSLTWVLPSVALANLLLPAAHVIWDQKIRIAWLPTEVDNWIHPPSYLHVAQLVDEAQALVDDGRLQDALPIARQAVRFAPHEAAGHACLATTLQQLGNRDGFREGQLDEILAEFQAALNWEPAFDGVHDGLAAAYMAAHQPEKAIEQLQLISRTEPEDPSMLVRMAGALAAAGRVREARDFYDRALTQDPDSAVAHYGLALVLLDQQQAVEAIEHLHAALDADPKLPEAHYALAGILAGQGDLAEAAEQYSAAVQLRPNYPQAVNNLGVVLMNQGEFDKAIGYFREAVRLRPDYADAQRNLDNALKLKRQSDVRN